MGVMQRRFTLRPPWGTLILAVLLFGGGTVMLGYQAMATGRRGLVINGLIHLDPGEAQIFFGVLAALSFLMAVMGGLAMVRLANGRLHVDVDDEGITLPGKPIRPRAHRFRYAEITSARVSQISGQVFLTITGGSAKSALAKSHLADGEFEEILAIVARHVPQPRAELPVAKLR
jgi:hypothetical protein